MMRTSRDLRGFSGVEILMVLAVIGVLAGAGYAATGHYRARAAEAAMREDLVHFVNHQQVFRQRTGALGTLEQLADLGFQRSPGVEVEADSVAGGRRAYLRVRHRKTGQRCSVDYSPYVSNALNRIQCWAGPGDPAGEVVAGADGPVTAPVDTVTVGTEEPPRCNPPASCVCAAVEAPGIVAPADQTGGPGSSGSGVFTLTNPGASPRTYSLAFSTSNAAVVPAVDGPASVTVPPGGSSVVTSSFRVDGEAEAGQAAVLPLEAVDAACPGVAANSFFMVEAGLALAMPVVGAQPARRVFPDSSFQAGWITANRTNAVRMMVLGHSVTGALTPAAFEDKRSYGRGETRTVPITYRLDSLAEAFTTHRACLRLSDAEAPAYASPAQCIDVTAEFLPAPPALLASPADRRQLPGTEVTEVWRVRAASNAGRHYRIEVAAGGDVQIVRTENAGDRVFIPHGGEISVRVTYRVVPRSLAEVRSPVSLQVEDAEPAYAAATRRTGSFAVTTELVLAPPRVDAPAAATAAPGAGIDRQFLLTNRSNAPRTFAFSLTSGNPALVADPDDPAAVTVPAFDSVRVPVAAALAARVPAGSGSDLSLRAVDTRDGTLAHAAAFSLTALRVMKSPAATWTGDARSADPGARIEHEYTVTNHTNDARTLCPAVSVADPAVLAPLADGAGCVLFAAYETKRFPPGAAFQVAPRLAAGTRTTASLRAFDRDSAGYASEPASFAFTASLVNRAPAVAPAVARSGADGAQYAPEAWHAVDFTVTNETNERRFLALQRASSAPGVVPEPAGSAGEWFEPYQVKSVTLSFHMNLVRAGSRSDLSLAASDGVSGLASPPAAAAVLAGPALRRPAVAPGAAVSGTHGEERTIRFTVANRANLPLRFALTRTSSNPAVVAALSGPGAVDIDAFDSVQVEVRFPIAAAASQEMTSTITLHAAAESDPSLAHAAASTATRINTAPVLGPAATRTGGNLVTVQANASDADGVVTSVAWWLTDPGGARTQLESGPSATFHAARKGTWRVEARATDNNDAATDAAPVLVDVKNEAPDAAPDFTRADDLTLTPITLRANASDADGDALTYQWRKIDPAGHVTDAGSGAVVSFVPDQSGTWSAYVVVSDGVDSTERSTGPIPVANRPPAAAFGDTIVRELYLFELQLTPQATDADGSVTGYQWRMQSVATQEWFDLGSGAEARAYFSALPGYTIVTVHPGGTYDLHLTVTDDDGATSVPAVKRITIIPGCADPLANNPTPGATHDDGSCEYEPYVVETGIIKLRYDCAWERGGHIWTSSNEWGREYYLMNNGTQTRSEPFEISYWEQDTGPTAAIGPLDCQVYNENDWPETYGF